MGSKHHAAPKLFRIPGPPGEGASRRPPTAARVATRVGFEHDFGRMAASLANPMPASLVTSWNMVRRV